MTLMISVNAVLRSRKPRFSWLRYTARKLPCMQVKTGISTQSYGNFGLVAQDQDLGGLPRFLTPGQPQPRGHPREQEEDEPQAYDR
jgi:hypothetical protein